MKKIICLTLCLLLILTLAACGAESRNVFLLTSEPSLFSEGRNTYTYDARGNLLRAEFPGSSSAATYTYTYDDYGYLTEHTQTTVLLPVGSEVSSTDQYLYTLKKGLPSSCRVISNGKELYACSFRTNRKGLITRVDYAYSHDISQTAAQRWEAFEYDRAGRLLQESFCRSLPYGPELLYSVYQYRYAYNKDGSLKSLVYETGSIGEEIRDPKKVAFQQQHVWEFVRNDQGQLTQITIDGDPYEFTVTGSGVSIPTVNSDWELDSYGNVTSAGSGTYEYQAAELSAEDADRFDRWNILMRSNNAMPVGISMLRQQCLPIYHGGYEQFFYYYLIPNPLT